MAIQVMVRVWNESPQKENKLLLMLALANDANEEGWSRPSQETLRKRLRIKNVRNIQLMLDDLEDQGEVEIYNRTDPNNREQHMSNVYHLPKYGNGDMSLPSDLKGNLRKRGVVTPGSGGSDPTIIRGSDLRIARVAISGSSDPLYDPLRDKEKESPEGKVVETEPAQAPSPTANFGFSDLSDNPENYSGGKSKTKKSMKVQNKLNSKFVAEYLPYDGSITKEQYAELNPCGIVERYETDVLYQQFVDDQFKSWKSLYKGKLPKKVDSIQWFITADELAWPEYQKKHEPAPESDNSEFAEMDIF